MPAKALQLHHALASDPCVTWLGPWEQSCQGVLGFETQTFCTLAACIACPGLEHDFALVAAWTTWTLHDLHASSGCASKVAAITVQHCSQPTRSHVSTQQPLGSRTESLQLHQLVTSKCSMQMQSAQHSTTAGCIAFRLTLKLQQMQAWVWQSMFPDARISKRNGFGTCRRHAVVVFGQASSCLRGSVHVSIYPVILLPIRISWVMWIAWWIVYVLPWQATGLLLLQLLLMWIAYENLHPSMLSTEDITVRL